MFENKLELSSGRKVGVLSLLVEQTGVHVNAVEPFPIIAGRFQMAVSGILDAAGRLTTGMPVLLADEWTAEFRAPEVHEHPIVAATNKRWESFVPPEGRQHPPRWTCVAWLVSSPVSRDDDNSQLVVGWFADQLGDLEAAIVGAASKLDWERHAQGWAF